MVSGVSHVLSIFECGLLLPFKQENINLMYTNTNQEPFRLERTITVISNMKNP